MQVHRRSTTAGPDALPGTMQAHRGSASGDAEATADLIEWHGLAIEHLDQTLHFEWLIRHCFVELSTGSRRARNPVGGREATIVERMLHRLPRTPTPPVNAGIARDDAEKPTQTGRITGQAVGLQSLQQHLLHQILDLGRAPMPAHDAVQHRPIRQQVDCVRRAPMLAIIVRIHSSYCTPTT